MTLFEMISDPALGISDFAWLNEQQCKERRAPEIPPGYRLLRAGERIYDGICKFYDTCSSAWSACSGWPRGGAPQGALGCNRWLHICPLDYGPLEERPLHEDFGG